MIFSRGEGYRGWENRFIRLDGYSRGEKGLISGERYEGKEAKFRGRGIQMWRDGIQWRRGVHRWRDGIQ